MRTYFAFECFSDQDVFLFLKDDLQLPLVAVHSFAQGEVINDVLVREKATIGMVDEDPGRTHHAGRDRMDMVKRTESLELRRSATRNLILLRPDLEGCFFRSLERVKVETKIAKDPKELHRILGTPGGKKHEDFREELKRLHRESRAKNVDTFITELETTRRQLLS